jgi:hypothetical protein
MMGKWFGYWLANSPFKNGFWDVLQKDKTTIRWKRYSPFQPPLWGFFPTGRIIARPLSPTCWFARPPQNKV